MRLFAIWIISPKDKGLFRGYVSLYISMYHYISVCITIYQYVSLYISMYQYVSVCITSMFHYVSLYISIYQYISVCITIYHHISVCITAVMRALGASPIMSLGIVFLTGYPTVKLLCNAISIVSFWRGFEQMMQNILHHL